MPGALESGAHAVVGVLRFGHKEVVVRQSAAK